MLAQILFCYVCFAALMAGLYSLIALVVFFAMLKIAYSSPVFDLKDLKKTDKCLPEESCFDKYLRTGKKADLVKAKTTVAELDTSPATPMGKFQVLKMSISPFS